MNQIWVPGSEVKRHFVEQGVEAARIHIVVRQPSGFAVGASLAWCVLCVLAGFLWSPSRSLVLLLSLLPLPLSRPLFSVAACAGGHADVRPGDGGAHRTAGTQEIREFH